MRLQRGERAARAYDAKLVDRYSHLLVALGENGEALFDQEHRRRVHSFRLGKAFVEGARYFGLFVLWVVLSGPGLVGPGRMDDHEEVLQAHA